MGMLQIFVCSILAFAAPAKSFSLRKKTESSSSQLPELGENEPRIVYGPRNYTGHNASEFADKAFELWSEGEWGYMHRSVTGAQPAIMSGSISVAFTATWDAFQNWSHILDFGQDWDGNNIVVGNSRETTALGFHSYDDRQNHWLNIDGAIDKSVSARYLCTMSSTGHYQVYREGQLIGDFSGGHPTSPVARPHMYIGKSFWSWDGLFEGHISKVCVWNQTMSWDSSLKACPRNKPGQVGDPAQLTFDPKSGAKLVIDNLGGLVNPNEPPIMKWENVGTWEGKKIDFVVKVLGPYVQSSRKTKRQGLVGKRYMGIILKYGTKAEMIFQFFEHGTNKPMVIPDFYFTVMDIDELYGARELVRVSDYDNFFIWHGNNTNMSLFYDDFGRTVFSSEPGAGGRFWDNPGKINKADPPGIVSKKGQKVDQRARLICFAYKMRSTFRMSFEAFLSNPKLTGKKTNHDRNFVFTFNPNWDFMNKDYGFWGMEIQDYHVHPKDVVLDPVL